MFSEFHCYSNFSFLKAASHPEELVEHASKLGYQAIAITDECSLAGIVRGWRQIQESKLELKLIVGSSFHYQGHIHVALAPTKTAYHQLSRFISNCRMNADKGEYDFVLENYLTQLPDCIFLFKADSHQTIASSQKVLKRYQAHKINPYLLLQIQLTDQDGVHAQQTQLLKDEFKLKVIASNGARMHCHSRKMLLDTLTAIRLNQPVSEIQDELVINGECYLKPIHKLQKLYQQQYLSASEEINQQCVFDFNSIRYQYPKDVVPNGHGTHFYLRQQTWQGAHRRYPYGIPKKVKKQIKKEFVLIEELNYEPYFLTVYDIVQFAKSKQILHQGRGSAANSVVCFCLGITEVDPTKVSLLFERFINRRRNEPPDIDVDFDNSRREEVIQYLYNKYGRDRCAIAATVVTYRRKSALRDVSKALGLDMAYLEKIIANYGWRYRGKDWIDDMISHPGFLEAHQVHVFKKLLKDISGFPRHLSQHVGGFILSQGPLNELVPIENATMEDRTVIQWDKDDLETMSLMKVDVLALGMLAAVQKCLNDLTRYKGKRFELQDIPRDDDPNVYGMLSKADTVGLFQVESRAQMNMLPRLKPKVFYDLVVQVAIVRPGPIHGDMVHPYLKRRFGEEPIDVPLKEMEPIVRRTFGVPIFQEQVIAIAMMAADFTADEAESLRRSMASWKHRGHMDKFQHKLHENLQAKGVSDEYVKKLQRQIEGFGQYGFPESHAASFALIAYYSAWLKFYYPATFTAAVLNSQPMGFYAPWQLIQDAQRHDVDVQAIDINKSHWDHLAHINLNQIQLGFRLIRGFKEETAVEICQNRPERGYQSIQEVIDLNHLNQQDLDLLASSHCFKSLNDNRFNNQWQVMEKGLYDNLFAQQHSETEIETEATRFDQLVLDHAATGVILEDHPIAYLRDQGKLNDCKTAEEVRHLPHDTEIYVAGMVTNRQRPGTSAGVTFVTLEDETGNVNMIVWLNTAMKQLKELSQSKYLKVYGKVDKGNQNDVVHFIAYKLFDLTGEEQSLEVRSRDYH